jgi:protein TonB
MMRMALNVQAPGASLRSCRWPAAALLVAGLHALALVALLKVAADDEFDTSGLIAVNLAPLPQAAAYQPEIQVSDPTPPRPVAAPEVPVEPSPATQAEVETQPRPEPETHERATRVDPIPEPPVETRLAATTAAPNPGLASHTALLRTTWVKTLVAHLDRHKRYPSAAHQRQQDGIVTVEFAMDRSGHLLTARVTESSGSPVFDAAAIELLRRSEPLPVPPRELPDETLVWSLPVHFKLR